MKENPGSFEDAAVELAARIDRSVERSVEGERVVGVAFSGGLDSSILAACASRRVRVVACTGYSEGSGDAEKSRIAADKLGVELRSTILTPERVTDMMERIELPFEPTLMDRSLWCLYSAVSAVAKEAGARVMLLGQLADELFGGYAKYSDTLTRLGPDAALSLMAADSREYRTRGRIRDVGACFNNVEPRFPFEGEEVFEFAESLPITYKIVGGVRKAVLRGAAIRLGVPEELAGAAKRAAQYSSGVQKLVSGLDF